MKLKFRVWIGALLVAAIAVPYVGYLINGEMPFIEDPRGMAATGLFLGGAGFLVMRRRDATDRTQRIEGWLAIVAGLLGLVTVVLAETAAATVLLAAFMVAVVGLLLVETLDQAGTLPGRMSGTPVAHG